MHALVDVRTHVNSACMHAGARGSISPLSSYTSAAPALPSHVLHHFLADDNVRGGGLFLLDLGAGAAPPGGDVGGNVSVSDVAAAAFSTGVASGYIHNPEEDGDVIIVTALAGADRAPAGATPPPGTQTRPNFSTQTCLGCARASGAGAHAESQQLRRWL